jgi:hypothetical protein
MKIQSIDSENQLEKVATINAKSVQIQKVMNFNDMIALK